MTAAVLDLAALLEPVGLDPASTLIVRHVPVEPQLKKILPWLVEERPDLWLAYQRIQWKGLEKAMTKASHVVSCIGLDTRQATLAGVYAIGEWETLDLQGYRSFAGNSELEAFGMTGRSEDMGDCLAFELEKQDALQEYAGRLTVDWPLPYQQWWRWADRGSFPIASISRDSLFRQAMPDWREIVLGWNELSALPASWKASLAEWRGIYLIWDTVRNAGYVGSAAGSENILGRWQDYASTGHGGNIELCKSNPADLRFSILQRTSPDLEPADIQRIEAGWKDRLHTREFGLNRN